MKLSSGFTLVELLVVISIISFLSSIVFTGLNTARVKARDTQRIEGLVQMRNALEMYYSANGHYPSYGDFHQTFWNVGIGIPVDKTIWAGWDYGTLTLKALVTGGYMPSLPQDPLSKNIGCGDSFAGGLTCIGSGYFPVKNGTCYILGANLEQDSLNTHKNVSGAFSGCGGYQITGGCKCSDIQDNQNGISYYGSID